MTRSAAGRLSLNVVSSWWADEARQYGVTFDQHESRYARTEEWLAVVNGLWTQERFTHQGALYQVEDAILSPKPVSQPRPVVYAGGESEAAKELIARTCDAYVMHGDPPARVGEKIADMRARRERLGLPPMTYGVAGLRHRPRLGSRGRGGAAAHHGCPAERGGLCQLSAVAGGDAARAAGVARRLLRLQSRPAVGPGRDARPGAATGSPQFEAVGVDLLLLQFSPQYEEMERFGETVIGE